MRKTIVDNTDIVEGLVSKYQEAARTLAGLYGPFSLFGLFQHGGSRKLDLSVAAPWLSTDRDGLLKVARQLPHLTPGEGTLIGRIVALEPGDAFVEELGQVVRKHGGSVDGDDPLFFVSVPTSDFPVTEGYVIAADTLTASAVA